MRDPLRTLPLGSSPTDPGGLRMARPQNVWSAAASSDADGLVSDVADVGESGEVSAPSRGTGRRPRTAEGRLCGRCLRSAANNRASSAASSRSEQMGICPDAAAAAGFDAGLAQDGCPRHATWGVFPMRAWLHQVTLCA
jgi:hypothetical protein